MSVIITFMFEPAKLQMNWASASGTSTRPQSRGRAASADGFSHAGRTSAGDDVDVSGAVVELVVEVDAAA